VTVAAARLGVKKELRALAGPWLASAVTILAIAALGARYPSMRELVIPLYVIDVAVLGAMSIGHEYANRTLGIFLSQPVNRRRLLLFKAIALAAALAAFAALMAVLFPHDLRLSPRWMVILLPLPCALFAAPWLTMVTRSAIAGALFSMAMPGMVFTATSVAYLFLYRHAPPAGFERILVAVIALTFAAVGVVMSWRGFMQLEAMEGAAAGARLPHWLTARSAAAPAAARRHVIWELLKKELHLQHLSLVVAALYAFWFLAARWLKPSVLAWLSVSPDRIDDIMGAVTFFYAFLVVLLIGSLASAEERQLGTLEWQMILPVAAWKQWAVKVAVIAALSVIVTVVLPVLLFDERTRALLFRLEPGIAVGVMVLATGSLYISSLCANGLRALVISVAAVFTTVLVVSLASDVSPIAAFLQQQYASTTLGAVASMLFTWRALANHRTTRG